MATLEKIRSKSALLVIVIGLALLAFIIGDAITNSRNLFGDRTTVAKVGDVKIDYNDFARKREELQQQMQNNPNMDPQLLSQMALETMITEALLDKAVEESGIKVSGEQLKMYLLEGGSQMPEMQQLLQSMNQGGMNVSTPQQAYDFIFNPKAHGLTQAQMAPYQNYWMNMEKSAKTQLGRQIYGTLLFGSLQANDLDKKYLFEDDNKSRNIAMAFKPYGKLDEKKYPVSEQEMKAYYDAHKAEYRIDQPMKRVSFIAVNVNPSETDRSAASKLAKETKAALRADSTGSAAKALQKSGVSVTPYKVTQKQIPAEFRAFVTSAPKDSIGIVKDNITGFAIVKMGGKTLATDSVQINIVNVLGGSKLVAQVKEALNGGLAIDSIGTKFAADSVMSQKDVWMAQLSGQQKLTDAQLDTLLAHNASYVVLQEVPGQGAVLAKINEVRPQVEVYNFQAANYTLVPSSATMTSAQSKFQDFLDKNATAEAFKKNAAKAGYQVTEYNVTTNMPAFPMQSNAEVFGEIPLQAWGPLHDGSSQVVGWVVRDGKAGKVSPMFDNQDTQHPMLYAVAVEDAFEDYVPLSVVKEQITADVRKEKAGAEMVKMYKGKGNVEAIAKAMGVNPQDLAAFNIMNGINQVRDAKVVGIMSGSKVGGPVVVVAGQDGVYAFQVKSEEANKAQKFDDKAYEQKYRQSLGIDGAKLLRGKNKVQNNIYNFIELQTK